MEEEREKMTIYLCVVNFELMVWPRRPRRHVSLLEVLFLATTLSFFRIAELLHAYLSFESKIPSLTVGGLAAKGRVEFEERGRLCLYH